MNHDYGKEPHICTPESCPDNGSYYVSAVDGNSCYLMAGPYPTHKKALEMVNLSLTIADRHDGRAWWMGWGTCRKLDGHNEPGRLDKHDMFTKYAAEQEQRRIEAAERQAKADKRQANAAKKRAAHSAAIAPN